MDLMSSEGRLADYLIRGRIQIAIIIQYLHWKNVNEEDIHTIY